MKKNTLYILLLAFITISACKKENQEVQDLIKTISNDGYADTFFYDSKNRLIATNSNDEDKTRFIYYKDSVVAYFSDDADDRNVFYINANGLTTKVEEKEGNTVYNERNYSYNANGKLIFSKFIDISDADHLTREDSIFYTNDNISSMVEKVYFAGDLTSRKENTYTSTTIKNNFTATLGSNSFPDFSILFWSRSVNFYKQRYLFNNSTFVKTINSEYNYNYTFDRENRLKTIVRTRNSLPPISETFTITYYE